MIPSPSFQPTLHRNSSSSIITTPTTADQRELARKESHSAIERRRREKMNDKIIQLKELIPSCSNNKETLHKMNILQNAIDYIIHLQETIKKLERNTTLNEDTCLLTCRNNKMKAQEDHNSTIKENTQTNHTKNQQCVINQSIPIEEDKRQEEEEDEEEDDDTWSASSLSSLKSNSLVMTPQKGLKPMDVIQNNNSPILPPKIVIAKGSQENSPNLQSKLPSVNMNIENILC
ncbi:uncharacterized protein BX663DRAFT_508012 [Cokeromyces recurvatus]|uniref:uncharacterized protein n=1 Tax=Cokeromyces recurvatus TaxID=90255 RepID=UPI00221F2BBE|nr:uncharacterized protein BX663DRAFT_508012 [Cokeromyces recurvatus]KAI7903265.1 hypothetical protein BX663DRAFT_508012 [Cokeromyces recurvatus]